MCELFVVFGDGIAVDVCVTPRRVDEESPSMKRLLGPTLAAMTLVAGVLTGTAPPAQAASVTVTPSCADVTTPGVTHCFALRRTDVKAAMSLAPDATPSGITPANIQSAYAL